MTPRTPDTERLDYPHLSAFHRYSLCPVSYQLSLLAPESKPTKFSESGTKGHKALAEKEANPEGFSQDELDTVEACRRQEGELVETLAGNISILSEIREERLWYLELGERLYSGQMDVIYLLDDKYTTSIIPDYKLGFLRVPPAPINLQLRGGSLLAWQNYGSRRSFVAPIQPAVAKFAVPALYELEDLQKARGDIGDLMTSIHSPTAVANPSAEACRYCAAKLICKAAYNPSRQIATQRKDIVLAMDDAELSKFGEMVTQANIIIEAAWDELKERVTARPKDFPAWHMKYSGCNSKIENPQAAYAKVKDLLSIDPSKAAKLFSDACKPSLKSLVNLVRANTKDPEKVARKKVEERLGSLLIKTPKSPSLQRRPDWEMPQDPPWSRESQVPRAELEIGR